MTVEVLVQDERWSGLAGLAASGTDAALNHLGLDPDLYSVSVLGCDDGRIADLNAEFRGRPAPTNVLSWPAADLVPGETPPARDADDPAELGDIAIAYSICVREAAEAGISADDHVTHLIVHATLHLLGYDHQDDSDAELMERLESEILAKMGIANPYDR